MVVNVITRHAPANYGSLLQTIATQKIITELGYECQIIHYIPKCESAARIARTQLSQKPEWNQNPWKKWLYLLVREPENFLMYRKFSSMRQNYLALGPLCESEEDLRKQYAHRSEDVFLTGSDQVWGPISTGRYDPAYFLNFAPEAARKMAFASSFGKAAFDTQTLDEYADYLKKYDSIAVREKSAVDIVQKMGLHAHQVLDPTLLVTAKEWESYLFPVKKPEKYILVYQIHRNPALDRYAQQFAQHVGLPLVRVSPLLHQIRRSGKLVYLPDIGGFLDLIHNAAWLITDSFHGTAFAINFNTQFVEVLPNTGTSSRNQSILELTGLTDRIVCDLNDFDGLTKKIDFSNANRILAQEREAALARLQKMLGRN